jgi:altronate dehydratase
MEALKIVHINEKDNAVISLFEIQPNEEILISSGERLTIREKIPASHKIALKDFKKGEPVIKYGEEIGRTNQDIPKGSWIHAHNMVGSEVFEEAVREGLREGGLN